MLFRSVVRNESELVRNGSKLVRIESEVVRNESELVRNGSELARIESEPVKNEPLFWRFIYNEAILTHWRMTKNLIFALFLNKLICLEMKDYNMGLRG